jgi:hypothetical protein
MRSLTVVLVLLALPSLEVAAQEPPEPTEPAPPEGTPPPPEPTGGPLQPPPPTVAPAPTGAPISMALAQRWRTGRILNGVGAGFSLGGGGLALSSILVTSFSGPPKSNTDVAPILAYMGSTASVVGFFFGAGGLSVQHGVLEDMQLDPGRGMFVGGTVLGVFGVLSVGASYFFAFTHFLGQQDEVTAAIATSIIGTVLMTVGGLLYSIDASRLSRIWERLTTF